MKTLAMILSITLVLGFTALGNATLWDRGGGLIYDDYLNITWMQDANYSKISPGPNTYPDGSMIWIDAVIWADRLVYGGYEDWRLPSVTCSANTDLRQYPYGELGYMYYFNKVSVNNPSFVDGYGNTVSFANYLANAGYWTNYPSLVVEDSGMVFLMFNGSPANSSGRMYTHWSWADGTGRGQEEVEKLDLRATWPSV